MNFCHSVKLSPSVTESAGGFRFSPLCPCRWLFIGICVMTITVHSENAPTHGMVASVHPLATEAGVRTLKSGGNAIDAAVAVGLTLGVVDAHNSGIGGGCFMLIRLANGEFVALDGREMAPAAATRDLFIRNDKGDTELSQTGPLASGVPGEVAVFDYAVRHHGKKTFRELALPAAEIAATGFPVTKAFVNRLRSVTNELVRFEGSRALFFPDGQLPRVGAIFKQPDLARTYRQLAGQGSDWFYRGGFAEAVAAWMKANGGILTAEDFANYQMVLREPVRTTYRGYSVVSFPPPSSGGVHVVQMLNVLEHFDLKHLEPVTRWHVLAETMKLAFADRAYWLGDPDYAKVPRGLIAKDYAAILARQINLEHATPVTNHGWPPGWERVFFSSAAGRAGSPLPAARNDAETGEHGVARPANDYLYKHTTHWSVADAEGNWVACTATINTTYGSKVVIPGTGVVLNNQMDDFSVQPGVPNAFGLIGAEANAVAPGKRPLSSMSPTMVLQNGQPIIALGAAGGPKIISAVLLELVAMLDLGLAPEQALAQPRLHQQWSPDELLVEAALPAAIKTALAQRGHVVGELQALAISQIVARSADGKAFVGAADPRTGGTAAGW